MEKGLPLILLRGEALSKVICNLSFVIIFFNMAPSAKKANHHEEQQCFPGAGTLVLLCEHCANVASPREKRAAIQCSLPGSNHLDVR